MSRDKATNQLQDFKNNNPIPGSITTSSGCPLSDRFNSLTVGPRGPVLLQDLQLIDEIAKFDRERIPERVVHAKGAGAFGYFEVTHDVSKYCKAKVFSEIGKKTPIAIRCSTVGGESGSSDSARDPRGFALKMYTEEGNWDLVGNNTPIFFIRDPVLFPSFIHTQKRNPSTHLKDPDMFWDFMTLRPETTHHLSFIFTDRGTPFGYRYMHGYGSHTYKLVNDKEQPVYCKFHYRTNQGIKNLTNEEADALSSSDPDHAIRDLYNAIADGNFPSWTMFIQVMTYEQAEKYPFNPFDLTKIWSHADYPLIQVGKFTLDRNPTDYFTQVEQLAFSPAHLVPGIEASPDKMLQARLFAYNDTHRHRLGPNYLQIPVNCPYRAKIQNYQRDGPMNVSDNSAGCPVYFPNSFGGPVESSNYPEANVEILVPDVQRYNSSDDDNFTQVRNFWRNVLTEEDRTKLVNNLANHLSNAQEFIQDRAVANFNQVDKEYGSRVKQLLRKINDKKAAKL